MAARGRCRPRAGHKLACRGSRAARAALGRELRASNGDARSSRRRTGTESFRALRSDGKSVSPAVSRPNLRYRAARCGVVTLLRRPGRSSRSLRPQGYPESLSCRRANRSRLALRLGPGRGDAAPGMPMKKVAVVQSNYIDRKSTRLNSSHLVISYAVFCLKKKNLHAIAAATRKLLRCQSYPLTALSVEPHYELRFLCGTHKLSALAIHY